jgi:hypothetical protein
VVRAAQLGPSAGGWFDKGRRFVLAIELARLNRLSAGRLVERQELPATVIDLHRSSVCGLVSFIATFIRNYARLFWANLWA